jgi:uncharacterized protein (TIRG00374 family)
MHARSASNPPTPTEARPPRWRTALRIGFGILLGGGAIWLVVNAAGGMGDALDALARVDWWWLLPAGLFEGLAYVLSGVRLRRLAGPDRVSTSTATGIELVVNGLGLLTPASPAEGLAFGASELSRRGLDRRRVALTLGFSQWFSLRVFLLVNALNLFWILATRDFPVDSTWALIAAPLVLVLLAVTAFLASRPATMERLAVIVGAAQFWKPRANRDDRRASGARFHADAMALVGPPRRRVVLMGLSVGSMLADIACLYFVLIAAHSHVGFDVALLAAGAAAASGLIPLLPGGLGVVEAIIPAVVHWYGPSLSAAFAGALVYRMVGTFLPAAAGAVAVVALRAHRRDYRSRTN